MDGKLIRLSKINCYKGQRACIVPIDHGTTLGPIKGLENSNSIIEKVIKGKADGIILHKGLLRKVNQCPKFSTANFILHLSVSTASGPCPTRKELVATVEEALQLGAVGVSVHVNLGIEHENAMIKDFAFVSKSCFNWGMPLLAMIYSYKNEDSFSELLHAARLGEELGADIIKIRYPGSIEKMSKVRESVDIPILISGGEKIKDINTILKIANDAMLGGANGVSIGRNIFQSDDPTHVTKMFSDLVKGNFEIDKPVSTPNI